MTDFFDGLGTTNAGIYSQHNMYYGADNNLDTNDDASPSVNECRRCHGTIGTTHNYQTRGARLYYPDAIGANAAGDPVPISTDFRTYRLFCLSCHDGAGVAANQRFAGPLPTQQAAPSSTADPGQRQAVNAGNRLPQAGYWEVPPVPQRDASPYFAAAGSPGEFYYGNGHGKAAADLSCIAGPSTSQACHIPHGSPNRFLIDYALGTTIRTVESFSKALCLECHTPGLAIGFHEFGGHVGTTDGTPLAFDVNPNATVVHKNVGGAATLILPFYGGITTFIENRKYRDATVPVVGPNTHFVSCLTCHEPHGSAVASYANNFGETGDTTPNTRGMLRKFPVYWLGTIGGDPLCGECHA